MPVDSLADLYFQSLNHIEKSLEDTANAGTLLNLAIILSETIQTGYRTPENGKAFRLSDGQLAEFKEHYAKLLTTMYGDFGSLSLGEQAKPDTSFAQLAKGFEALNLILWLYTTKIARFSDAGDVNDLGENMTVVITHVTTAMNLLRDIAPQQWTPKLLLDAGAELTMAAHALAEPAKAALKAILNDEASPLTITTTQISTGVQYNREAMADVFQLEGPAALLLQFAQLTRPAYYAGGINAKGEYNKEYAHINSVTEADIDRLTALAATTPEATATLTLSQGTSRMIAETVKGRSTQSPNQR